MLDTIPQRQRSAGRKHLVLLGAGISHLHLLARLVQEAKKIHIGAPCADENRALKGMLGPIVCRAQVSRGEGDQTTASALQMCDSCALEEKKREKKKKKTGSSCVVFSVS